MLNELAKLCRALGRYNLPDTGTHPWVKRLGHSETLILGLDESAQIRSVELLAAEEAVALFKIQQSNYSNFPGVNLTVPIYQLDTETRLRAPGWKVGKGTCTEE